MNSRNLKKPNNKKSAFTLVEVMVSILIISMTAMMFSTNIFQSFQVYQGTQDIVKASDLAQKYIEQVKSDFKFAVNYDAAAAGSTPPEPISDNYTDKGYYTVTTSVNDLDSKIVNTTEVVTLKEVNVTYAKASDSTQMVQLSTIIARPEN